MRLDHLVTQQLIPHDVLTIMDISHVKNYICIQPNKYIIPC